MKKALLFIALTIIPWLSSQAVNSPLKIKAKPSPPYYCHGLTLIDAQWQNKAQRGYTFQGQCQLRHQLKPIKYRDTDLTVEALWNNQTQKGIEKITLTDQPDTPIIFTLHCDNDPWISKSECQLTSVTNTSGLNHLSNAFTRHHQQHPPLARGIATAKQALYFSKQQPDHPPTLLNQQPKQIQSFSTAKTHPSSAPPEKKEIEQATETVKRIPQVNEPDPQQPGTINKESTSKSASTSDTKPESMPEPASIDNTTTQTLSKRVKMDNKDPQSHTELSVRTFPNPVHQNHRVDYCYKNHSQCGQYAAHRFCQLKGYRLATNWAIDADIGSQPQSTRAIGDQTLCNHAQCDGFSTITCQR